VPALSISIVTYCPRPAELTATLGTLGHALQVLQDAGEVVTHLQLIDHSPEALTRLPALASGVSTHYRHDPANPGFGAGHNRVLAQPAQLGEFHLVLNPDVELAPDALSVALAFMRAHPDCVLLSPAARYADGSPQWLCKRYPSVLDLALRGFAPPWLKQRFARRLARYEMQDIADGDTHWDPPIVSGCFMLLRSSVFRQLGGFDEHFFLYFEDFDLSLRAARYGRLAHVPAVRIVHHGGHAARKGGRHILMFARSGLRFFRLHGWRLW
jgi:GT2 family glycosyltransferase